MFFKKIIVFITILTIFSSLLIGIFPVSANESTEVPALPLAGRVVLLDPGHDPAFSPSVGSYVEHIRMFHLANEITARLTALGATVHNSRGTNINRIVSLQERAAWANRITLEAIRNVDNTVNTAEVNRLIDVMRSIEAEPEVNGRIFMNYPFNASRTIHEDLRRTFEYQNHPLIRNNYILLSLHSNATASGLDNGARGLEAFYISPTEFRNTNTYWPNYSFSAASRGLADLLLKSITGVHFEGQNMPIRGNGLRAENSFILREVNMPAVLVENGFHTSTIDRGLLMNNTFMSMVADAYIHAIITYFSALPNEFTPLETPINQNGWNYINGSWYFHINGVAKTGWIYDSKNWYYADQNGVMQTGWIHDGTNWYFLKANGDMATGWIFTGGSWYFLKPDGDMATGWVFTGGAWYFMKPYGAMATGWVSTGGSWYFLTSSGAMATGWITLGGVRYFLNASGAMVVGNNVTIGNQVHNFNLSGAWLRRVR
ncbi:MAG: N-acetylmuramoyl-L-alanine amidase [Oscillospiraceae bacterium]|jgi:N-acetylmuramoyl-L-alanine amidase|nr:N-acetylmuramoyl-L-alanine amidase [Oscillospiraceae bacterium]